MRIKIEKPDDLARAMFWLRVKYKLTQMQVARGAEVSLSSIMRFENGQTALSSKVAMKVLLFFSKYFVKGAITLSIKPSHDKKTHDTSDNDNLNIR